MRIKTEKYITCSHDHKIIVVLCIIRFFFHIILFFYIDIPKNLWASVSKRKNTKKCSFMSENSWKSCSILAQFLLTNVSKSPLRIHPPPERISPASVRCVTNRTDIRIFRGLFRGTFRAFPWHFQGVSGAFHGHSSGFFVAIFSPGFAPILPQFWPLCLRIMAKCNGFCFVFLQPRAALGTACGL